MSISVVCAPNAFKGTLTARAAAEAMARGVRDAGVRAIQVPVADGGDGTLDVLVASRPNDSTVTTHTVMGPMGNPVRARLGRLAGTAVVELAEASGLRRLGTADLDPLHATSRGTGELIRIALDAGASRIVVGVGGSACTDGGAGLLQALGAHLVDASGAEIGPGGAGLEFLDAIDLSKTHPGLRHCAIEVACDVRSPLLGSEGAARGFAPQKGANAEEVQRLEQALAHFAAIAAELSGGDVSMVPGAGCGGGCGFGLALVGAHLGSGAQLVCDLVGLDDAMTGTAAVLTGEGKLDSQTATGKAPAEVATRANRLSIPCIAICGTVADRLPALFSDAISLAGLKPGVDPMRHTRALLRAAAREASHRLLRGTVERLSSSTN